jgi:hypothetical protein
LLRDGDVASGEGEVVIGGEESNQADGKATDGLADTEPVKPEGAETLATRASPGEREIC